MALPPSNPNNDDFESKGHVLRSKIMLTAIVILFFLVILMVCLHFFARWYLLRARRRHLLQIRHQHRTQLVFYVDTTSPAASAVTSRGLDAALLKSLPLFVYSSKTHPEPVECAVCLSELEENETGRVLPKCNHSFHIDCIDMWFQSHSTCPLCRAPVESAPEDEAQSKVVITVCEPVGTESSSSSGFRAECHHEGEEENRAELTISSSSSSIGFRRKPSSLPGITIEVPRRNESFGRGEVESGSDSPSTQPSFRLSFKRILSRDRKASFSPTAGDTVGCSSMNEMDTERGRGREEAE